MAIMIGALPLLNSPRTQSPVRLHRGQLGRVEDEGAELLTLSLLLIAVDGQSGPGVGPAALVQLSSPAGDSKGQLTSTT